RVPAGHSAISRRGGHPRRYDGHHCQDGPPGARGRRWSPSLMLVDVSPLPSPTPTVVLPWPVLACPPVQQHRWQIEVSPLNRKNDHQCLFLIIPEKNWVNCRPAVPSSPNSTTTLITHVWAVSPSA